MFLSSETSTNGGPVDTRSVGIFSLPEPILEFAADRVADLMGRTGLPWAVLTRADTYMTKSGSIDREKWRFYRDNGCYALKIGVEGVQQVMDASHKHLSEEVVREFVPAMQDLRRRQPVRREGGHRPAPEERPSHVWITNHVLQRRLVRRRL